MSVKACAFGDASYNKGQDARHGEKCEQANFELD
jgi:hypothetical protein